ncbi:MAG: polysaccharide biosynthesis protein [Vulcanimicrobiota bacterium]
MDIRNTTILILGAGGMVGTAVCRELIKDKPAKMVLASLREYEVDDAIKNIEEELKRHKTLEKQHGSNEADFKITFAREWGNIFVRDGLHQLEMPPAENPEYRKMLIEDTVGDFGDGSEVAQRYFLYKIIQKHKPDIIIDCINTATGIAYQNIFKSSKKVYEEILQNNMNQESVERLLCSLYIPQLIRHVQVLYKAMTDANSDAYVKVGTSGTGGMGLNIPYTHGEERPSRVLLSKSAIGGAHTLLLMLLSRTPDAPMAKEVKPTAAIAWKQIGYGEVKKGGKPVKLEDVDLDKVPRLGNLLDLNDPQYPLKKNDETLKATFIDTGENGLFSVGEFVAISTVGQMEFVTPEEIARNMVSEIKGTNTGKDVLTALSSACMDPSFRAGFMRNNIIERLRGIQEHMEAKENEFLVSAFELLGPPRLSKLLYEAYLLKLAYKTVDNVARQEPEKIQEALLELIKTKPELRSKIISIGIPILIPDGKECKLLRGSMVKIPAIQDNEKLEISDKNLEEWAHAGWVDLRISNMKQWILRMNTIIKEVDLLPRDDSSSRYIRNRDFWTDDHNDWAIDIGEIAGWIFITEDQGERGKE